MNISKSQVTKIILSDLKGLDNVAIYLEDYTPGSGKLIITCFSSSWTYYWSHMGEQHNLSSFIRKCSTDYLSTKLMNGAASEVYDLDKTIAHAKSLIILRRKLRGLSKSDARDLYNLASERQDINSDATEWYEIFGEEFWHEFQKAPSADWIYLCKVLDAVKEGLELDVSMAVAA